MSKIRIIFNLFKNKYKKTELFRSESTCECHKIPSFLMLVIVSQQTILTWKLVFVEPIVYFRRIVMLQIVQKQQLRLSHTQHSVNIYLMYDMKGPKNIITIFLKSIFRNLKKSTEFTNLKNWHHWNDVFAQFRLKNLFLGRNSSIKTQTIQLCKILDSDPEPPRCYSILSTMRFRTFFSNRNIKGIFQT